MKRSWDIPRTHYSLIFIDIHFDKVNIPSLSQFLCFHSFFLPLTQFPNRFGVLARGQSHLTQLGTATAEIEVFEAQRQKHNFRGNRIHSWESHPPAFSQKLRQQEKTNAGKSMEKNRMSNSCLKAPCLG